MFWIVKMTEMKQIPTICTCKKELDCRIVEVREDEKDKKSKILAWLIHGFCKPCQKVFVLSIIQGEEKPVQNRDFMLSDKVVDEVKK